MLGVTFRENSRSMKIHAMQQAIADSFRENVHGIYTDFAVSFCENSHHAHIPTHRCIRLRTAEADSFREHVNFRSDFCGAHGH